MTCGIWSLTFLRYMYLPAFFYVARESKKGCPPLTLNMLSIPTLLVYFYVIESCNPLIRANYFAKGINLIANKQKFKFELLILKCVYVEQTLQNYFLFPNFSDSKFA